MNVIWVVSDTVRRDHLGAYGNETIHTPSLDALAAKSMRFDRHYVAGFPTMPARADYLTGLYTMSFMKWEPLPNNIETLPQYLAEKGFHTAAVVDTPFFTRVGMNYDRGFQTFFEVPGQLDINLNVRREGAHVRAGWRYESDCFAPQTFSKAMQWLERHYKENFFLYVDTWDPHEPWEPPKYYTELYWPDYDGEVIVPPYGYWQHVPGLTEEKVKKAHAAYCGEITMVDTWLGYFLRMVEYMGLMENTAIIFTSDHGYYFGEHGGLFGKMVRARDPETGQRIETVWTHSPFYEEITSIPLFIYLPNNKPGSYNGLTSAVDLMPTVLDILNIKIPSQVEGKSLLPMIKNPSEPGRDHVISAHPFMNPGEDLRSVDDINRSMENASTATVTTNEWTLLYNVVPGLSELYHLPSDPRQNKNVIAQNSDIAHQLHQLLVKFMQDTKVPAHIMKPRLELQL